ncbi:MAG: nucleotide exchange factor GrpE [Candidatus Dadabacteria bacterium]|nr:nucleotide exchange factor GrpE [Candidatus Dadabacteria bacterium]
MDNDKMKDKNKENPDYEGHGILEEDALPSGMKALQDELEAKKREYDELYDRYLRAAADFDNYKKRVAKEKADIIRYGNEELVKELLHVLDNLERALEHSENSKEAKLILEGINLVHKQLLSCLEKFGVNLVSASKGDKFDPRFHQAVEYEQSSEITPDLIISEILKGYTLRDRLLRPSLVVVSKEMETSPANKNASAKTQDSYGKGNSGEEELLDLIDENSDNN